MSGDSDYEWVLEQLNKFVRDARPKNGSGDGVITFRNFATCGRPEALRQLETVKPILDKFYPDWREDNAGRDSFEFAKEHDAAQKLIARLNSKVEVENELAKFDTSPSISASGMHRIVWEAARPQWNQGFQARAVDSVARAVNSMLQRKLNRVDLSEVKLVQEAFSERDPEPGKPRLRFDIYSSADTNESMRRGAMDLGRGLFAGVRNPIAHVPDDEIEMSDQEAVEALAAFSLFARWVDQADIVDTAGD